MPFCPQCKYEYVPGVAVCPDCDTELVESLADEQTLAEPVSEIAKQYKESKLVTVYATVDLMEAEMLKSFLESSGISCFLKGSRFGSLYPLTPWGTPWGEIELQVSADFEEKAREILEELRRP